MSELDPNNLLVETAEARDRIQERLDSLSGLSDDSRVLMQWHEETGDTLDAIFVNDGKLYFDSNSGFKFAYVMGSGKKLISANRERASGILKKVLKALAEEAKSGSSFGEEVQTKSNEVFVVHGHHELGLSEVSRTLEKLKLRPVVLREQPNRGATIIEKFERNDVAN